MGFTVKGAKYDPKSRPPSGRGSRQTTGTALAELMLGVEDLSKMDVESTLEEFIRNQPSPGKLDLGKGFILLLFCKFAPNKTALGKGATRRK